MKVLRVIAVAVLVAAPVVLPAQAKPNFSGTWKCDVKRSVGCSDNSVAVIKHDGDSLTMTMGAGKGPQVIYRVGETVTTAPMKPTDRAGDKAPQSQVTARWEGDVLLTEVVTVEADKRIATSTWRLSADGKELIIDVKRTGRNTEPSSKYVYIKQ